jgi:hypothetical protein
MQIILKYGPTKIENLVNNWASVPHMKRNKVVPYSGWRRHRLLSD